MAKVIGPILSSKASGAIGNNVIYSERRGTEYVKSYVVPADPQTAEQLKGRSSFTWLESFWRLAPFILTNLWELASSGKKYTARNLHNKINLPLLRTATNSNPYTACPGVLNGPPTVLKNHFNGIGNIVVMIYKPPLPNGWTLTGGNGVAFIRHDPHGVFNKIIRVPTTIQIRIEDVRFAFSALPPGKYTYSCWLTYKNVAGKFAASLSISGSRTAT